MNSFINEDSTQIGGSNLYDISRLENEKRLLMDENIGLKILIRQLMDISSKIIEKNNSTNQISEIITNYSSQIAHLRTLVLQYESKYSEPKYKSEETQTESFPQKKSCEVQTLQNSTILEEKVLTLEKQKDQLLQIIHNKSQTNIEIKMKLMLGISYIFDTFRFKMTNFVQQFDKTFEKLINHLSEVEHKTKRISLLINSKKNGEDSKNIEKFQNDCKISPQLRELIISIHEKIKECSSSIQNDHSEITTIIKELSNVN